MEYLVGVLLALAVLVFTSAIGFDRDRSFYPTVLIVVASYYDLFAVMGGSTRALLSELLGTAAFLVLSAVGFKRNMWRTKDKATNSETFLMSTCCLRFTP